jgi:Ni/Co efflux regulator RcnB
MKKILTGLTLSLSAIVATSAMAAPHQDGRFHTGKPTPPPAHWNAKDFKHDKKDDRRIDHRKQNFGHVNPSREWRTGDKLPKQYDSNRYRLNDRESRHLPATKSNQSWYKVNGDYVLVNERNNKIVRIIG